MKFIVKKNSNYEAKIYIGSCEGYSGPKFSFLDLKHVIGDFQKQTGLEIANPVRVTATTYIFDTYEEDGWEIAIINYPRKSKSHQILHDFALELAAHLLEYFHQNRISVVFPEEIVMLESLDAQISHK